MFNPSRAQVRAFFSEAWQKRLAGTPATPIEVQAADWIAEHPEYHDELLSTERAETDYRVEQGRTNPWLHLSMHLALQEQVSIDQPPGVRAIHDHLLATHGEHETAHRLMEALGTVLWEAQRLGQPLDNERYLALLRKHAGL